MNDPEIKVTCINGRYHARLYYRGSCCDEMACQYRQDIGVICKELMRWFDKLGGSSVYADKTRHRTSSYRDPVGKIWYRKDLENNH